MKITAQRPIDPEISKEPDKVKKDPRGIPKDPSLPPKIPPETPERKIPEKEPREGDQPEIEEPSKKPLRP